MADPTPDTGPITLINVFEIRPDDVELFLQEWHARAQLLGRQPGFRSLRLHRALSPDSRFQLVMSPSGTAPRRYMQRRRRTSSNRARSVPCMSLPLPPTPRSIASSSKPPRSSNAKTVSSRALCAFQQRRDAIAHPCRRQDWNVRRSDGSGPQVWATGERPTCRVSPWRPPLPGCVIRRCQLGAQSSRRWRAGRTAAWQRNREDHRSRTASRTSWADPAFQLADRRARHSAADCPHLPAFLRAPVSRRRHELLGRRLCAISTRPSGVSGAACVTGQHSSAKVKTGCLACDFAVARR